MKIGFRFWMFALVVAPYSSSVRAEEMSLDLSEYCQFHLKPRFQDLDCDSIPDSILDKEDDGGNRWKIRFHFGNSRTTYGATDLHVRANGMDVVVRDVEMVERTSASHYNPANWEHLQDALRWIDEPTNTFTVSFEKGPNILYITVFHPKYLKSFLYRKSEVEGQPVYQFGSIGESDNFSQTIPDGWNMYYIGNTHLNMVWQVGYGRRFTLFKSGGFGRLSYIPKADFGIGTGRARSVNIIPGELWDDHQDSYRIQSTNLSFGHRLEYDRGALSVFIDHKVIFSDVHHGFLDGSVDYSLRATPITFGIGIDLFPRKKRSQ